MMLFTFAPCMQHPCVIIPPGRSTDPDIIRLSFWGLPLYHSSPLQNHRTVSFASTVAPNSRQGVLDSNSCPNFQRVDTESSDKAWVLRRYIQYLQKTCGIPRCAVKFTSSPQGGVSVCTFRSRKMIGREGQNDNKSRGVSIKGSHGAFRWCPHSQAFSTSGCLAEQD
jgi:hypothetical protein